MAKRVAFVDNNLDNFHANTYLKLMRKDLVERGFEVSGCHAMQAEEGRQWAEKNGVKYFDSPAELAANADYFMVLAPSTPETHLDLFNLVAPQGKPTYIDKPFAPNLKTAREIFALADKHKTPLQTSSALRYTNVQELARTMQPIHHMVTWGGGRSFAEYGIHPVELMISVMGPEVESVMKRESDGQTQLLVNFSGGRTGVVNVYCKTNTPFAASLTSDKETKYAAVDGDMFKTFLQAQLDYFDSGKPTIDRRETLAVRLVLDAADDPVSSVGFLPVVTSATVAAKS